MSGSSFVGAVGVTLIVDSSISFLGILKPGCTLYSNRSSPTIFGPSEPFKSTIIVSAPLLKSLTGKYQSMPSSLVKLFSPSIHLTSLPGFSFMRLANNVQNFVAPPWVSLLYITFSVLLNELYSPLFGYSVLSLDNSLIIRSTTNVLFLCNASFLSGFAL